MKRLMTTWDDKLLQNPHEVADKRSRVQKMFAAIAPSYDLNNRLHSLWMDQRWRRKAVDLGAVASTDRIIDIACGTGDLTAAFADQLQLIAMDPLVPGVNLKPAQVTGIDFTYEILPMARSKFDFRISSHERISVADMPNEYVQFHAGEPLVNWINGDAQFLPLADQSA